jgi:crotonobetainyl-CoA dehydrogenase
MDFRLTEEQELLIQQPGRAAAARSAGKPDGRAGRQKEFPHQPWQALADHGILSLGIPEEYGGTPATS